MKYLLILLILLSYTTSTEAAVSRIAAGTTTTGTTACTPTATAGVGTGQFLIVFLIDHGTVTYGTSPPTGWTKQAEAFGSAGRFQAYTARVGQGGLVGTSGWSWTSLTTHAQCMMVSYNGVDSVTPMDVIGSAQINASGTTGTTSITTVTNGAQVVAGFAALSSGVANDWTTEAVTTSPTLVEFFDSNNSTYCSIGIADGTKTTAGSTGTSSVTMTTATANAAILLALRPSLPKRFLQLF